MSSVKLMLACASAAALAAVVVCMPQSGSGGAYQLPADSEAILSAPINPSFSCDGQPYG